ncbi:XRE family transcriptional regulator [Nocardia yunnanensis]|uniref:XRE family transcriptional regulator n=1 Tax=Nocardia yunnanensis TaxID=2382165 RepID=A0A386ZGD5_9NOCA|nr:helix-turn-helix transcriptional regulator [Nocardia yunnanensis]AYF76303.1 XRE family transcriptional regulator [Nocardia yunnanensis]
MREIKLGETLKRLIEAAPYHGNRRRVSHDLGITTAALSQYLRGQNNPSVDKLVAMSDLFGVSLDFLMFGEDSIAGAGGTLDYGPIARYMEASLASTRAEAAVQSAFVAKIGAILADGIDEAARKAAKRPSTFAGMLDHYQTLELERFSTVSIVAAMDLQEDLKVIEGDIEEGVAPQRFLDVVVENLEKGRRYHFVLSPDMQDREFYVRQFINLLSDRLPRADIARCKFSVAAETFYVGFCLFRLDIGGMRKQSPVLFQYVQDYIGRDGWIGFTESPTSDYVGVSLMNTHHRNLATRTITRLIPEKDSGHVTLPTIEERPVNERSDL